jgi:antitoxin MazE
MKANIVQIGNSKGVRIPKTLLEQLNFEKLVEFQVMPDGLLLRPVHEKPESDSQPRAGWDEMFQSALAENGEDVVEEFADWNQDGLTEFDEKEW